MSIAIYTVDQGTSTAITGAGGAVSAASTGHATASVSVIFNDSPTGSDPVSGVIVNSGSATKLQYVDDSAVNGAGGMTAYWSLATLVGLPFTPTATISSGFAGNYNFSYFTFSGASVGATPVANSWSSGTAAGSYPAQITTSGAITGITTGQALFIVGLDCDGESTGTISASGGNTVTNQTWFSVGGNGYYGFYGLCIPSGSSLQINYSNGASDSAIMVGVLLNPGGSPGGDGTVPQQQYMDTPRVGLEYVSLRVKQLLLKGRRHGLRPRLQVSR